MPPPPLNLNLTILNEERHPLDGLFAPKSVAVIGATDRPHSLGQLLLGNLVAESFQGQIYPVNPHYKTLLDLPTYPTIADVPGPVDLAVIVTPAATMLGIVQECVAAGVKNAIIVSAGFRETGPEGASLEAEIGRIAKAGNLRLIGPNCLGVMSPPAGLNATFARQMALPGGVAFVSQSGALCTAVLDWSQRQNIGFSAFISTGSMADIAWGELISYLGHDPHTRIILLYMEALGDVRSFISAAREVALSKPIIVLKPGHNPYSRRAAQAHTGVKPEPDWLVEAVFRRCGVLQVQSIEALFNMAEMLAKQVSPRGPHLTIVTNAGGPGVLAVDALLAAGGELTELTEASVSALNAVLPAHWSHGNPIDILGDADPARYATAVQIAANDPHSDGLLVIVTPQAMTSPTQVAKALSQQYARPAGYSYGRPVLVSLMGGAEMVEGEAILNEANIATFPYPDTAVRVFAYLWQYQRRLRTLYETPQLPAANAPTEAIHDLIAQARSNGRLQLTETEMQTIFDLCDLPIAPERPSPEGFELSFICQPDPQFGLVLRFGAGGQAGLIWQDWVWGFPPLNSTLARRLMEESRIYHALPAKSQNALEKVLVRLSELVAQERWIATIRLDSLWASEAGLTAVQPAITLYPPETVETDLPRLAIRPYPVQYAQPFTSKQGETLLIRPIRPEDEPKLVVFHGGLSENSIYLRYFRVIQLKQRIDHERLSRICFIDYDREMVLVAERDNGEVVAAGRLNKSHKQPWQAEFALLIADAFQGYGLGTEMLSRLLGIARQEGITQVIAYILGENRGMLHVCQKLGFRLVREAELYKAIIDL